MAKINVTVARITEKTEGNGNFVVKLEHHQGGGKATPFGKTAERVSRYYMEVEECNVNEGDIVPVDLDDFTIVQRSFEGEDGDTITLDWLQ